MADSTSGFDGGSYSELSYAFMMGTANPGFFVASATDWAPTAPGSTTRTVSIAAGSGVACGVRAVTNAATTVTFGANGGGTDRYDAVVARWNWTTNDVTLEVLTGSSVPPVINPSGTLNSAQVNRIPGVRYDGVIAIVRVRSGVTQFTAADVADMRVWHTASGPTSNASPYFITYVDGWRGLTRAGFIGMPYIDCWLRRASDGANALNPNIQTPLRMYPIPGASQGTWDVNSTVANGVFHPLPGLWDVEAHMYTQASTYGRYEGMASISPSTEVVNIGVGTFMDPGFGGGGGFHKFRAPSGLKLALGYYTSSTNYGGPSNHPVSLRLDASNNPLSVVRISYAGPLG